MSIESINDSSYVHVAPRKSADGSYEYNVNGITITSEDGVYFPKVYYDSQTGAVYAENLEGADIQGSEKNDNLTLIDCQVKSINMGKGDETLNALGQTSFKNSVVFEDNKGDAFNVENKEQAFGGKKDWCKGMWNRHVNTDMSKEEADKIRNQVEDIEYTLYNSSYIPEFADYIMSDKDAEYPSSDPFNYILDVMSPYAKSLSKEEKAIMAEDIYQEIANKKGLNETTTEGKFKVVLDEINNKKSQITNERNLDFLNKIEDAIKDLSKITNDEDSPRDTSTVDKPSDDKSESESTTEDTTKIKKDDKKIPEETAAVDESSDETDKTEDTAEISEDGDNSSENKKRFTGEKTYENSISSKYRLIKQRYVSWLDKKNEANGELDMASGQGTKGDCVFIAACYALASTEKGYQAIKDSITINKDANGKAESYTVNFKGLGKKVTITDKELNKKTELSFSRLLGNPSYASGDEDMALLELAYKKMAKENKDDDFFERNDRKLWALKSDKIYYALTGKDAQLTFNTEKFLDDVDSGKISGNTAMDTGFGFLSKKVRDVNGKKVKLHGIHAYTISDINKDNATLLNPWNTDEKIIIPREEFARVASEIYYVDLDK